MILLNSKNFNQYLTAVLRRFRKRLKYFFNYLLIQAHSAADCVTFILSSLALQTDKPWYWHGVNYTSESVSRLITPSFQINIHFRSVSTQQMWPKIEMCFKPGRWIWLRLPLWHGRRLCSRSKREKIASQLGRIWRKRSLCCWYNHNNNQKSSYNDEKITNNYCGKTR